MSLEPPEWRNYLATGISLKPGDSVPVRKEISDIAKSPVELNLLLEGLAKFQNERPLDDPKSWFQIAGIHGKPYTTWPNQSWNEGKIPQAAKSGFCTHSSILFLTWHRPYLALFESILYEHVQDFVKGIPDDHEEKQHYVDRAKAFRLPYWDWAKRGQSAVPEVATATTDARQHVPPSTKSWFYDSEHPVYNPLYHYPWPTGTPEDIITDDNAIPAEQNTVRHPRGVGIDGLGKRVDADFKKRNPLSPEKNLSERTAYILQSYKKYSSVSNNRASEQDKRGSFKPEIYGSLEDTHNSVHNNTGGGGHMSDPKVAAFDPIFWLHHTNIDRLFAIWQGLNDDGKNKDAWVVPQKAGDNNWTTAYGTLEKPETKLYPFRPSANDKDDWYTSENTNSRGSTKRTEPFGYTYPETAGLTYPVSKDAYDTLYKRVTNTYANAPNEILRSRAGDTRAGEIFLPQAQVLKEIHTKELAATHSELVQLTKQLPEQRVLLQQSLGEDQPYLKHLLRKNEDSHQDEYLEWLVNIKAQRHALGGKYSVHVFLNDVNEEDVSLWPVSPHHVGSFVPFGQSSDTGCANCKEQQEQHLEITGQIPLTIALIERFLAGIVENISEEQVIPYLQKNLHWRVESGGSILDDRSRVDGLTVFVVSNKVTLPESDTTLPIYDDLVTPYPQITTRVDGGGRGDGTGLTEIPQ